MSHFEETTSFSNNDLGEDCENPQHKDMKEVAGNKASVSYELRKEMWEQHATGGRETTTELEDVSREVTNEIDI